MDEGIPLKLKSLSNTRWIAHLACINRIVQNWRVFQAFFNDVRL